MDLNRELQIFASLNDALAALHATPTPLALARFEPEPALNLIIAVNQAAAADPSAPLPGDHPDNRRDPDITADIELGYLYEQLVGRGHAQQVVSFDHGHLYELTVTRIEITGETGVHAFVSAQLRNAPEPG